MTIIANDIITTTWYTPKSEIGESEPTRFKIKPLNGSRALEVRSDITFDDDGSALLTGRALNIAIKHGLVDWDNFVDSDGKGIPFSVYASDFLSASMRQELASEIIKTTSFDGSEKKTS